ncbi:Glycosyl transferases group 1 [Desulfomicrobium apsheronum]|uniref:Glycosyl transferases group 1 n=1 Tax=Desulfomicrobium apsheronum TaxID=52560 RepID=A0A1I3VUK8_9BACT|nr:glycosyltransferase [Desulfomicrobium apsheronum]SFJ97811.1 Glycosyl transferases group 1 [Desulfomicrobium apsheronum]
MLGLIARKFSSTFYRYPQAPVVTERQGEFAKLKVALITDHLTETCLTFECRIKNVTPRNYREVLRTWRPDILLVESAFHGSNGCWRYELAKQSRLMRLMKPTAIFRVLECARALGIPSVFWNKDDGAYFEHFIDIAKGFDHVFTTDETCIPRYRAVVPASTTVNTLMIPYQPAFHSFEGFDFSTRTACFTGSYYRKILNYRRLYLDMLFQAAQESGACIDVFDRNHDRLSRRFEFSFPETSAVRVHPRVSHWETGRLYKSHALSINVNSVTDSETMCSRRLLEILACGGIAMTNPSKCVMKYFAPYCQMVSTPEEAREVFARLHRGPDKSALERAAEGARYVRSAHTWAHRVKDICEVAGI